MRRKSRKPCSSWWCNRVVITYSETPVCHRCRRRLAALRRQARKNERDAIRLGMKRCREYERRAA